MENVRPAIRGLVGSLGLVLLVGCASQSGSAVPVEDRGYQVSGAAPTTVVTAAPEEGMPVLAPVVTPRVGSPVVVQSPGSAVPQRVLSPTPAGGSYAGPSPVLLAFPSPPP